MPAGYPGCPSELLQAARRDNFAALFGIQHVYATVEELLAAHGAPDTVADDAATGHRSARRG